MAPIATFVIPVLDEETVVAPLLADLRQRFPGWETIVVDGGSRDRTVERAAPLCDLLLSGERGRARQMNLGAGAAQGGYLVFLHADSRPGIDGDGLHAVLAQRPEWGFCRVRLGGRGVALRIIEWSMNQRSRLTRVATGDQMMFVRRGLFEAIGGFAPIPLMEDVALSKRLRALSAPRIVTVPVVASSRRWERRGVVATVAQMWWLRLAYFAGVSPERLWRHYYGE